LISLSPLIKNFPSLLQQTLVQSYIYYINLFLISSLCFGSKLNNLYLFFNKKLLSLRHNRKSLLFKLTNCSIIQKVLYNTQNWLINACFLFYFKKLFNLSFQYLFFLKDKRSFSKFLHSTFYTIFFMRFILFLVKEKPFFNFKIIYFKIKKLKT